VETAEAAGAPKALFVQTENQQIAIEDFINEGLISPQPGYNGALRLEIRSAFARYQPILKCLSHHAPVRDFCQNLHRCHAPDFLSCATDQKDFAVTGFSARGVNENVGVDESPGTAW